jgi:hypothetical protein
VVVDAEGERGGWGWMTFPGKLVTELDARFMHINKLFPSPPLHFVARCLLNQAMTLCIII